MDTPQHTPGPWKAQRDIRHELNLGTLTDASPKAWAVYGQSARVACITSTLGVNWDKDAKAEANAHLIAAAPELLAALVSLEQALAAKERLPQDSPEGLGYYACEAMKNARAAIAKAKGGAA